MCKFKKYRVNNPVIVDGQYTHIRSIPSEKEAYYSVSGNGNAIAEEAITPIPMAEIVFRTYKDFRVQNRMKFESNGHKIEVDIPSCSCFHDDVFIGTIEFLHELYNLLDDFLDGYHMTYYYPTTNQENDQYENTDLYCSPCSVRNDIDQYDESK